MTEIVWRPGQAGEAKKTLNEVLKETAAETGASCVTVRVPAGTYGAGDFDLCGDLLPKGLAVIVQAEEGAVIHGGKRFEKDTWLRPDAEMAERFDPEVRDLVRMIPLADFGLTEADYGTVQPIGAFHTAYHYDVFKPGRDCAFFTGGERMRLARYPNAPKDNLFTGVVDLGEYRDEIRNQRGTTVTVDEETAARMARWKEPETAWIFGYFYFDWADASSPIVIRPERREVYLKYVANYGAREGAPYYVYNIPEELDEAGEYYLDRASGNLYFIPRPGAEHADLAYGDRPLIEVKRGARITYRGFTLTCAMSNAVRAEGEELCFADLTVENIQSAAITVSGRHNTVMGCRLSHLAQNGIEMIGGDRASLTRGNNRAIANTVTHFGQVSETYRPGISLGGVGNIAAYNEVAYAPHAAITYGGNDHTIAYNDIHHVVLKSSDAGAIYSGRDSVAHGTVIRGNLFRHIGDAPFTPHGIYWDDCLSGQCAMDNVLVDVLGWGFEMGGGCENVCVNNLVVRSGWEGLEYDERIREGLVANGWYQGREQHIDQIKGRAPDAAPWCYRHRFTCLINTDPASDPESPLHFVNPSRGAVKHNLTLAPQRPGDCIAESVRRFSAVEDNAVLDSAEEAGWDDEACVLRGEDLPCGIDPRPLARPDTVGPAAYERKGIGFEIR